MKKAFVPDGVSWRLMGEPFQQICTLPSENPPGKETMVSLPLDELLPIMAEHLAKCPSGTVLFEHEVLSIGQDDAKAWVNVKTPQGEKRMEADYIVGCDGANSKIRRELFGNEFPGFTWDKQIVATNVRAQRVDEGLSLTMSRSTTQSSKITDGRHRLFRCIPNTFQVSHFLCSSQTHHAVKMLRKEQCSQPDTVRSHLLTYDLQ